MLCSVLVLMCVLLSMFVLVRWFFIVLLMFVIGSELMNVCVIGFVFVVCSSVVRDSVFMCFWCDSFELFLSMRLGIVMLFFCRNVWIVWFDCLGVVGGLLLIVLIVRNRLCVIMLLLNLLML